MGGDEEEYPVLVDYQAKNYKGYMFVMNPGQGFLLVKKKGSDVYTTPGEEITQADFEQAATESDDRDTQLMFAARAAAVRALYAQTGLDTRHELDMVSFLNIQNPKDPEAGCVANELDEHIFYLLQVTGSDFAKDIDGSVTDLNNSSGGLQCKLSDDLEGFCFVPVAEDASKMMKASDDGIISTALLNAMKYQ